MIGIYASKSITSCSLNLEILILVFVTYYCITYSFIVSVSVAQESGSWVSLYQSEVAQLCPTLWDSMDCSPPGSSVHGIFQARILEGVTISFSRGSSQPRDQTWISCITDRFFTAEPSGKQKSMISHLHKFLYTISQKRPLNKLNAKEKLQTNIWSWAKVKYQYLFLHIQTDYTTREPQRLLLF